VRTKKKQEGLVKKNCQGKIRSSKAKKYERGSKAKNEERRRKKKRRRRTKKGEERRRKT
jgi:hypothetical protein